MRETVRIDPFRFLLPTYVAPVEPFISERVAMAVRISFQAQVPGQLLFAGMLFAGSFLSCMSDRHQVELIPVCSLVLGEAVLERDGRPGTVLRPGMVLREGDVIRVAQESKVVFAAGEGNEMYVLGQSSFKIARMAVDSAGARSLDILMPLGEIFSSMKRLTKGSGFSVATPTAVASIRGTNFNVRHTRGEGSTFSVLSGKVAVTHRGTGGLTVLSPLQKVVLSHPDDEPKIESVTEQDIEDLKQWVGDALISAIMQKQTGSSHWKGAANGPPHWFSSPRTTAYHGMMFHDTVRAEDPEKRMVTYELDKAPRGFTLNSKTGVIRFFPRAPGRYPVSVFAVDDKGLRVPLQYTLDIRGGLQAVLDVPSRVMANETFVLDAGRSMSRSGNTRGLWYRFDINDDGVWDFPPDGQYGPDSRTVHRIGSPGTYRVRLEVRTDDGQTARAVAAVDVELDNKPPVARIRVSPPAGLVNQVVTFDASQSVDSHDPAESLSVRWDLDGNGTWDYPQEGIFTRDKSIFNIWDHPGKYRVCVLVKDLMGGQSQGCADITIYEGVVVDSLVGPDTVRVGEEVRFVCRARAPDAGIKLYEWNTDADSAWDFSTPDSTLLMVFGAPGQQLLVCEATDSLGLKGRGSKKITVMKEECSISAGGPYSTRSVKPLFLQGMVVDTGAGFVEFQWDFTADGTVDWTGARNDSCSFSYPEPGLYSAVFSATTPDGRAVSDTAVIMVHNSPPKAFAGKDVVLRRPSSTVLTGTATDADNDIALYEWDFDGDGTYDWSSPDTGRVEQEFEAYSRAVLRVTDREGAQAIDTVVVILCSDDMVLVEDGGYCIDKYEFPNQKGMMPRANVTHADAERLCKEEQKRLCTSAEWITACRGKNNDLYPYGRKFRMDQCNTMGNVVVHNSVTRSGYFDNCRSGEGTYDMSGNVSEWTSEKSKGNASVYGGSYQHNELDGTCESRMLLPSGKAYFYVGFRCCR